jgi:pantetheine-phosphate adenylyltransferase/dephospho-CoA kinase
MVKAIYAFSGDPITYGHIDIIERASKAFDNLIVGIGVNPAKKYMFSLKERTEMAQKSLSKFSNVEVVSFEGSLVDYAYENCVDVIVKGVRNARDFEYEKELDQVGKSQKLKIDTHVLFANSELEHISSSAVKGIQSAQGSLLGYVPLYVKQCLEAKMSGQYIVGVTGEIGSGKSYVSQQFVELGKRNGIEVHNIELDYMGHQLLGELTEPQYKKVRQKIADTFGNKVRKEDGTIDRKSLGDIVFADADALDRLNKIMETPLLVRLRRELSGKKGLILFNAALIAESNMTYVCNNNVVLVYADKQTQESRLGYRGLAPEQMQRRLQSQFNYDEKKASLQQAIDRDNQGNLWNINNSNGKDEIESVFSSIISELRIK